MSRYRVLYVSNEEYRLGGSSLSLLNMLQSLGEEVEPVILFKTAGCVSDFFQNRGYKCLVVPFYRNSFSARGLMRVLRFIPHAVARFFVQNACVRCVVRECGHIDAVHSNSSTVDIGLKIASRLGVPHVWHFREYYDVGLNGRPFPSWASWRRKLRRSNALIAITPGLFRHFGLDSHINSFCIPDAVCNAYAAGPVREERNKSVLFIAGTVSEVKRPADAVQIFAASGLEGYELVIIGSTDHLAKDSLTRLAASLGVSERVRFVPFANDVRPYLESAAAVLVCTENEGMGRVAVEAMFAGCPVVARNSGGSRDVLGEGRYGSLYDTIGQGAEALKACTVSFPKAQVLEAQQEAERTYSIERYGAKILQVYDSVCLK